ncbi:hypothetical protein MKX03_034142 [Papaver bracteatum]|nr:hypothetical protein MKX03_034142 [Papaver bracteatum]
MESPFMVDIVKGKVALITGGGSGIGFEITKEFLELFAIMGNANDFPLFALSAIGFVGDVRNNEDASRVVDSTFAYFGRIDILVNAAAGNFLVPAEDLSPNGFKTGKHINGTILVVDGGDWFNRDPHVSKEAVKELSRSVEKRSTSGAPPPESGVPTRSKM